MGGGVVEAALFLRDRAELSGASLGRTDLSGADLSEANGLRPEQVESAVGDGEAKLPRWMPRPSSWPPPSDEDG
ncbi:hypothetical protein FMEAI12_5360008 [Parafrankia sp. Ea1.12]|uniref:pentapeptide repeat-containing protein n=1 Tax=Parafrankia sp. Ea1.12 TaxID=573499 RepID=UPI000DA58DAA|nr:hypothetical protein FMEAI12_5360008 [Parafrankia sp. Ea1.12]